MTPSVYTHFTLEQRKELHQLLKKDLQYREKQKTAGIGKPKKLYTYQDIGDILGKNKGSISREISDNSILDQKTGEKMYDAEKAHHKAYVRAKYRPNCFKNRKIVGDPFLQRVLEVFLPDHSPEQIAGRLNVYFKRKVVSHTLIYEYCYSSHGQYLSKHLLCKRSKPKKWKKVNEHKRNECGIPQRTSIDKRPEIINTREEAFHYEVDILGSLKCDPDRIGTIYERKSRLTCLMKLNRQGEFMGRLQQQFKTMSQQYGTSIVFSATFDNGIENKTHYLLFKDGILTYFCHAYCSWEKGGVENTNGRTRRYIPKKQSIAHLTQEDCDRIAHTMNHTPRKCLGYRTPYEVFFEQVMLKIGKEKQEATLCGSGGNL